MFYTGICFTFYMWGFSHNGFCFRLSFPCIRASCFTVSLFQGCLFYNNCTHRALFYTWYCFRCPSLLSVPYIYSIIFLPLSQSFLFHSRIVLPLLYLFILVPMGLNLLYCPSLIKIVHCSILQQQFTITIVNSNS